MPFIAGNGFLVVSLLVFLSVILLLESGWLWWRAQQGPRAKRLRERLRAVSAPEDSAGQPQVLKQRRLSESEALERRLRELPRAIGLGRFIAQSGLQWTAARLVLMAIVAFLAGFVVMSSVLHQEWIVALAVATAAGMLPFGYVARRRVKRLAALERQLPDALDLLGRALRAGHAFTAALKMAGEEMAEPIGGELRMVHDEINFGVSLPQALTHLSQRVPLTDLRYFVVAVLIQRESGGNLAEVLGKLSSLIRDRLKLLAKVRVLSSEGRMSAWILSLMPFALGGAMFLVNPGFMAPLWNDPIGISIMKWMLGLMAIGVLIMRKIIRIRY